MEEGVWVRGGREGERRREGGRECSESCAASLHLPTEHPVPQ